MRYINRTVPLFTAMLAVLFLFASPATAQEQNFSTWDENSDGELSQEEFATVVEDISYIQNWDYDTDGVVTKDEWASAVLTSLGETHSKADYGTFGEWDQDGNRELTQQEFNESLLRAIDENGNRTIDEEEFNRWYNPQEEEDE